MFLKSLGTHFPSIKNITNILYRLQRAQNLVTQIDNVIYTSDFNKLIEIRDQLKLTGTVFNVGTFNYATESSIISTHSQSFIKFNTRVSDKPLNVCMSCHKLCFRRDVVEVRNLRKPIVNSQWDVLVNFVDSNNLSCEFICNMCLKKFGSNTPVSTCILNDLFVPKIPEVLASLNEFERQFIQRAKAFQVVVRMATVSGRKQPNNSMLTKAIDRVFHLPTSSTRTDSKKIAQPQ